MPLHRDPSVEILPKLLTSSSKTDPNLADRLLAILPVHHLEIDGPDHLFLHTFHLMALA